ncbi:uncharacterized protein LOC115027681 [Cottoperca gobio]|uniref:Uncharacterized protein LOC115027681 n=1 Tax=Cottoperca gobio TaxID=56716 RepID=A0A6J2S5W4_COTGO|nr:uncharacterized protein LOC115027681 [Cottoperca gobio]
MSVKTSRSWASNTNSVLQTPPFITKKTGESVASEIHCSHNVTNADVILWYKQDEHKALKLLGYLNVNYINIEDDVKGKISFDGDALTLPPAALQSLYDTQFVSNNMEIIIRTHLLRLSLFLLWTSGLTDGSHVTQMDTLWQNQGKDATMNCSHTKGATYYQMYWYRQLPGETMKLIVYTTTSNKDHDFGDFKKEKFSATKPDAESGTFTVKDVQPEDNGLYFCAVSEHSDTDTCES